MGEMAPEVTFTVGRPGVAVSFGRDHLADPRSRTVRIGEGEGGSGGAGDSGWEGNSGGAGGSGG